MYRIVTLKLKTTKSLLFIIDSSSQQLNKNEENEMKAGFKKYNNSTARVEMEPAEDQNLFIGLKMFLIPINISNFCFNFFKKFVQTFSLYKIINHYI